MRLYLPLFILIGLYTGRRKEAILSLRWPQVDLGAGRIDFEIPGRKRNNKRRGEIGDPRKALAASQASSKARDRSWLCVAHQREAHRRYQEGL